MQTSEHEETMPVSCMNPAPKLLESEQRCDKLRDANGNGSVVPPYKAERRSKEILLEERILNAERMRLTLYDTIHDLWLLHRYGAGDRAEIEDRVIKLLRDSQK